MKSTQLATPIVCAVLHAFDQLSQTLEERDHCFVKPAILQQSAKSPVARTVPGRLISVVRRTANKTHNSSARVRLDCEDSFSILEKLPIGTRR